MRNIDHHTDLGTGQPKCEESRLSKESEFFSPADEMALKNLLVGTEMGLSGGRLPGIPRSPARPDELIGDERPRYLNEDDEHVQCNDADCEGWLYAIDGADMLECGACGATHGLDGEIVDDDDDSDPPTPEDWASSFEAMSDEDKAAAVRLMTAKMGFDRDMADLVLANMGAQQK